MCAWCGQQLAAVAELAEGTRLSAGRYQILRVIGRGGFGITYDAGDRRLQRRVAMKELFPESAVRHGSLVLTPPHARAEFRAARERFLREARVLARFTHPGIVRVYEVFEEHGTAYLVMELLEGRTLIDLLQGRGHPLPEVDVLDVAGRVAAALRPVHAAGVLHRDVNPSNVMLTHHGRIVVIDFGLARDYQEDQTAGMSRVVTPGYAPLEQYRGEGQFGPPTDVYGLAATCYRLATGKVPRTAIERDAGAALASPRSLNPSISKAVSDAILDGLELEPAHRPQDLDAFLSRLGVRRLPEGPRSRLIDTVPPPPSEIPAPAPVRAGLAAAPIEPPGPEPRHGPETRRGTEPVPGEPVTGVTEIVARRLSPGPPPAHQNDLTAHGATEVVGTSYPGAAHRAGEAATAAGSPLAGRPVDAPPRAPERIRGGPAAPRVPGPVGPHAPGRRKVLLPLTAVALAVAMAAPVLALAVLVIVVLPLIATMGDARAHRLRTAHGVASGWAERRMTVGALAAPRLLRNILMSIFRATPLIGIGAVLLAAWYGLDRLSDATLLVDVVLRAIGLLVVGGMVAASRHGSSRFRTGLGLESLVDRWVPEGRTTERLVILWIVAAALVAGSIWLTPDPFPLP